MNLCKLRPNALTVLCSYVFFSAWAICRLLIDKFVWCTCMRMKLFNTNYFIINSKLTALRYDVFSCVNIHIHSYIHK